MTFRLALPVRFADCDPAGIAYFPRLLALVDAAIEDWTAATLGIGRDRLHREFRRGLPTVWLETEFDAPARLGDRLEIEVEARRIGATSLSLAATGWIGSHLCLRARLVQVLTDLDTMRPEPWPDDWRASLSPVCEETPG